MKLIHKRILIFFSIALNIGFLITAGFQIYNRSIPITERRWHNIKALVQSLDLPESVSDEALENMKQFRTKMDKLEQDLNQARTDTMRFLSRHDAVDRDTLHGTIQAVVELERNKADLFEAHVVELKQILGNDKGADFFSRLLKHIKSKHRASD